MSVNNLYKKLNETTIDATDIIKSVRLFEKDGLIHMDYRVFPQFRREGKERIRFSTAVTYSSRTMKRMEHEMYQSALEHYLTSARHRDTGTLKVKDIALDALNEGRHNRQADTQADYLAVYESFIKPEFGERYLQEVRVLDVRRWKDTLLERTPLSRERYLKYHRCLNFIFQYALENELVERNVVALVDRKSKLFTKSKQYLDGKYYTAAEVDRMLTHATGWFKVMLMVYLHTGMRSGEGLALKWSDIDFTRRSITIQRSMRKGRLKESTKTGEDRAVLMSLPLKKALLAYKEVASNKTWLFPNPRTGKPYWEARAISNRYFKPLLKVCDIEYRTFYALRHTFASLAAQKNIPMSIISKQLGHKNIATTTSFYIKNNLISDVNNRSAFDTLYS